MSLATATRIGLKILRSYGASPALLCLICLGSCGGSPRACSVGDGEPEPNGSGRNEVNKLDSDQRAEAIGWRSAHAIFRNSRMTHDPNPINYEEFLERFRRATKSSWAVSSD